MKINSLTEFNDDAVLDSFEFSSVQQLKFNFTSYFTFNSFTS